MAELVRHALRGKCCELSLFLHHGQLPALLLDEVLELARENLAFRSEDDA